jgi:endonuclease YncB( thermonuclease family)
VAFEQAPADRAAYAEAEREAREARRGLGSGVAPVAPWEWRKGDDRIKQGCAVVQLLARTPQHHFL